MENRVLYINHEKCVGCGACEMICSLVNEGVCSPRLSRIRVVRFTREARNAPVSCAACENAPCLLTCVAGAIYREPGGAVPKVNTGQCIGCRQCNLACPFGHMNFHPEKKTAYKCELCGGDPQCAKFCWTGAIQFVDPETVLEEKRTEQAGHMLGLER
ncbi:4Fe-4S dicluster domain-containing protein [Syntrophomonas palmitatica]|uniref:4Fe-4S dicluster domain-containing protein n=1 Tax=Syntrophomonas palmitatica TaxID=402877 RepID=UPI0006D1C908|nr:4Fe-4S dicluster domain-containing protein [Syntrophomonas palmitatica]